MFCIELERSGIFSLIYSGDPVLDMLFDDVDDNGGFWKFLVSLGCEWGNGGFWDTFVAKSYRTGICFISSLITTVEVFFLVLTFFSRVDSDGLAVCLVCSLKTKFERGFFIDERILIDGFIFVGVLLRINFCGLGGRSPERVII